MDQEMKDFPSHAHNADKLYCCSYCVKAFVKKTNLQIHLRKRNTEKPFQCSQCNKPSADAHWRETFSMQPM